MDRYNYSSAQVNLPSSLTSEITRWGEDCISDYNLFDDPNYGRMENAHITLLYGLHSERPDDVRKLLLGVDSFEIELGKISMFTWCDKFDVVKIEAFSNELHRLNKLLSRLPSTQIYPTYYPHVTIAFIKKGTCRKLVDNMAFGGKIWMPQTAMFSSKFGVKTLIPLKSPQL